MNKLIAVNAALLIIALVGSACSQGAPEKVETTEMANMASPDENPREAKFKSIGRANRAIKEELEKSEPSLDVLRTNAAAIAELSPDVPTWFPTGSGPESGMKTEALPAIWERPPEFAARAADLDARAQALLQATGGTDLELIRTRATELGATCKSCHDQFRQKK